MDYFKLSTNLQFIKYPKFLFSEKYSVTVSQTAKIIYALLTDRAISSSANTDNIYKNGNVFVIFTIEELAKIICKSDMAVKNSLKMLEENHLIVRKSVGVGKPTHIYILYPENADNGKAALDSKQISAECNAVIKEPVKETTLTVTQKENNSVSKDNKSNTPTDTKLSFGKYKNVFLTEEQLSELKRDVRKWEYYINRISEYMFTKGRNYPDHALTIRQWAEQDGNLIKRADYSTMEK